MNIVEGADRVARLVSGFVAKHVETATLRLEEVSGQPGIVAYRDGLPVSVVTLAVADGRVRMIAAVVNPEKLRTMVGPGALAASA